MKTMTVSLSGSRIHADTGKANLHLEIQDDCLRAVVPKDECRRLQCYARALPQKLLKFLDIADPTALSFMITTLTISPPAMASGMLDDEGIVPNYLADQIHASLSSEEAREGRKDNDKAKETDTVDEDGDLFVHDAPDQSSAAYLCMEPDVRKAHSSSSQHVQLQRASSPNQDSTFVARRPDVRSVEPKFKNGKPSTNVSRNQRSATTQAFDSDVRITSSEAVPESPLRSPTWTTKDDESRETADFEQAVTVAVTHGKEADFPKAEPCCLLGTLNSPATLDQTTRRTDGDQIAEKPIRHESKTDDEIAAAGQIYVGVNNTASPVYANRRSLRSLN